MHKIQERVNIINITNTLLLIMRFFNKKDKICNLNVLFRIIISQNKDTFLIIIQSLLQNMQMQRVANLVNNRTSDSNSTKLVLSELI